ncbi:MarR family winged helix-turn-helix transcriptional regulator [Ruminococcaceae bacterium OttesenSCG-928-A16]|nr:MarR family winged helix-turn-helix transcriptional regulator [Ruminococcaceae bacterium OttesenSCG-928-A16]
MDAVNLHWKIMDTLRRIGAAAERKMHPFCTQHNITPLQLNLLITLQKTGPQTVSALAKRTTMAGANNSALCKKMEKDGLVLRERDPDDERQVLVSLTPQGRQMVQVFATHCSCLHKQLGPNITPQEFTTITTGLETLQVVLERIQQNEEDGK